MVDAVLGEAFAGVLVSGFYAGYAHYPGVKQKCWTHLLRDVHDVQVAHEQDAAVQAWAAGVHDVYRQAVAWKDGHATAGEEERRQAETLFMQELQAVCAPDTEAHMPRRVLKCADGEISARVVRLRAGTDGASG